MTEDPRIDPADLRNVRFPGSSRRYDARSVDQFLETVASRIAATNELVDSLRARVAELDAAAPAASPAPPAPELGLLDDEELVKLVGEETASVLSTARRAADEIRTKAEESAARMIREATAEADRLTDEAKATAARLTGEAAEALEQATTEATAEAERIRAEATQEAERVTAEASELLESERAAAEARRAETDAEVERILEEARDEGRGMVNEAKEVRTRILDDLQRRRDSARDQIERLLAGRERLLAAYDLVRENLDDITGQLADALPDPGEPELPDGFVGIVGTSAPGPAADDDAPDAARATDDEVTDIEPADVEPDDTVAPVTETEAEIQAATEGADHPDVGRDEGTEPLADDADATAGAVPDDVELEATAAAAAAEPEPVEEDESPAADDEPVPAEPEIEEPDTGEADEGEPTELEADEAEAQAPGAGGDVDELFARLRAEREESVAKARQVVEADVAPDEPVEEPAQADEPAPVSADDVAGEDDDVARGVEDEGGVEDEDRVGDAAGDVDRVPAEFLADDAALAARAEALGPLEAKLNRALKRRLADEQNEMLDLLRRTASTQSGDLLPDATTQIDAYASLAVKHLAAAAEAGGQGDVDVSAVATALGAALVEPFRRRVERSASEVDGDPDELDERLRALYREWKVQHIGPVADDALLSAYALGTLSSARPDGHVRWRIDPAQGPCPDAQDNALAGEVRAGEAFPTGDACPQAHPGCRCLLVAG